MKSMIVRFVATFTWIITALAALHIGLVFWFGERADVFYFIANKPYGIEIIGALLWVIGLSGVFSLVMLVVKLFEKCCPCGCDDCSCDKACCK